MDLFNDKEVDFTIMDAEGEQSHTQDGNSPQASRTLEAVIAHVEVCEGLSARRRQRLINDCRLYARRTAQSLGQIKAHKPSLIKALRGKIPGDFGMKPRRFADFKSNVLHAVTLFEEEHGSGHSANKNKLSPEWVALLDRLKKFEAMRLRPFGAYCSELGGSPDCVTSDLFDSWAELFTAHSTAKDPAKQPREARNIWNRLVEDGEVNGAVLPKPPHKKVRKSLSRDLFTDEINAELDLLEQCLRGERHRFEPQETAGGGSLLDLEAARQGGSAQPYDDEPVQRKAVTVKQLMGHAMLFASTPVMNGDLDAHDLNTLDQVLNARNVIATIERVREGGDYTGYHETLFASGLTLLKTWSAESEPELDAVKTERRKLRRANPGVTNKGIAVKNRTRLAQYDADDGLRRLYELPHRIFNEVERDRKRGVNGFGRHAGRVRNAAMLGLVLAVPMRQKNLRNLKIGSDLILPPSGQLSKRSHMTVILDADVIKNTRNYGARVALETAKLIQVYVDHYRPLIMEKWIAEDEFTDQLLVFPSTKTGKALKQGSVSRLLREFVARELGTAFNPHLARHLASKLLIENGHGFETAGAALGHAPGSSATHSYAEFQTGRAVKILDQLRKQLDKPGRRPVSNKGEDA